jgi:two-component sensor histidine kinase
MRIMPKTGAFEAIVLGLSEQSHRHQAALAQFADCALSEPELDRVLLEACRLCCSVLHVPAARILAFSDESGLTVRTLVRREDHDLPHPPGGDEMWVTSGGNALSQVCVLPGTTHPRVLACSSTTIDDGFERFGLLEIDRAYEREFSELELDFIASVARLLGRAVARNRETEAMRQANEALAAEAEEARTMLRELSHRVRNDLQVLEGHVYLQRRAARETAQKEMLGGLGRRIMSLAALYDHLLTSSEPRLVSFDEYVSLLCIRIQDAQDLTGRGVTLEVVAQPFMLPVDRAVALGIVTNELISNAVEHAFPNGRGGRVRVALKPEDTLGRSATLTIADDGVGAATAEGNGMRLARRLVGLHGGTLRRDPGAGTSWTVSFSCLR